MAKLGSKRKTDWKNGIYRSFRLPLEHESTFVHQSSKNQKKSRKSKLSIPFSGIRSQERNGKPASKIMQKS